MRTLRTSCTRCGQLLLTTRKRWLSEVCAPSRPPSCPAPGTPLTSTNSLIPCALTTGRAARHQPPSLLPDAEFCCFTCLYFAPDAPPPSAQFGEAAAVAPCATADVERAPAQVSAPRERRDPAIPSGERHASTNLALMVPAFSAPHSLYALPPAPLQASLGPWSTPTRCVWCRGSRRRTPAPTFGARWGC